MDTHEDPLWNAVLQLSESQRIHLLAALREQAQRSAELVLNGREAVMSKAACTVIHSPRDYFLACLENAISSLNSLCEQDSQPIMVRIGLALATYHSLDGLCSDCKDYDTTAGFLRGLFTQDSIMNLIRTLPLHPE